MWFLIYVLPFLVIGGIIFIIAWTVHEDNQNHNDINQQDHNIEIAPKAPRLYEDVDEQRIHEQTLQKTTSAVDYDFFYSKKIGIYQNVKNCIHHTCIAKDFPFSIRKVYNAIQMYRNTFDINNYIIQIRTKHLLSSSEESSYRNLIKENGSYISIQKDISNFDQNSLNCCIITIKCAFFHLEKYLLLLDENNIDSLVVVDDYNPTIFTLRDKHEAFNYNYRIKLCVSHDENTQINLVNECRLIMDTTIINNAEEFLISLIQITCGKNANINYYKGLVC